MIDTENIRKVAKDAYVGDGWVIGEPYTHLSGDIVDVLTEPEGCEVAEFCLPQQARFIVLASIALVPAAKEIDDLRAALHLALLAANDATALLESNTDKSSRRALAKDLRERIAKIGAP